MPSFSLVSRVAGESSSAYSARAWAALAAAEALPRVVSAPLCSGVGFWVDGRLVAYVSLG